MASLDTRSRADGGTTYRVRWMLDDAERHEGAPGGSETFNTLARAQSFKRLVEECGEQWPEGWVKGRGHKVRARPRVVSGGDWRGNSPRGSTCQLCGLVMPTGQWGFADGPLCRPDDQSRQNCYQLWVEHGVRPERGRSMRQRPKRQRPKGRSLG